MVPTQGLYGGSFGAPYGGGIFVAPMLARGVRVMTRTQCRSLVARLSTPLLASEALPSEVTAGKAVHLAVRAALGRQPLDALSVHFKLGSDLQASGAACDAITLPSGLAQCWVTVPEGLRGAQPLSVEFAGTPSLHAVRLSRIVRVTSSGAA